MKKFYKKALSLLLSATMLASNSAIINIPETFADDEMKVTVSIEGLTIGQGLYFEPETYTLSEINELIAQEGYDSYEEEDLTAAIATLAFFIDNGIEYKSTGDITSDFYLSSIKDIDTGEINIPQIIYDGGFSDDYLDENDDEYLGEFDYSFMSGWMITVNDLTIPVGAGSFKFQEEYDNYNDYDNSYVVRWQFTLWGYGADLGVDTGWGSPPYFDHANKDLLYQKYAELSASGYFDTNSDLKTQALSVMENLTATEDEVDEILQILNSVSSDNTETDNTETVKNALENSLQKLSETVTEPSFGTTAGEWSVLCLARGDFYDKDSEYFKDYYQRIVETVNSTATTVGNNGALSARKLTENSRLIIALSSIGKNAESVGDWNILAPLEDFDSVTSQGINGGIFALIALDTQNYQTVDSELRQKYIEYILSKKLTNGGWALIGTSADPDITSMALQALAPYTDDADVASAVDEAVKVLSDAQNDDGGFASWGSVNAESIAQVIVALTSLGINPNTDERFIKNGKSTIDALLEFYDTDTAMFKHTLDGKDNAMATDQCIYALVSYNRFLNNKNSLYDMTDVELETIQTVKLGGATLSLKGNIGVNLYMELSNSVLADENAYMEFTLPNGKTSKISVSDAEKNRQNGKDYYVFSCEMVAKEMTDTISAKIVLSDGTSSDEFTYSVKEYADTILNGDYSDETKALVTAMLNYGDYAKAYFNGTELDATAEMNSVTADTLSDYAIVQSGELPDGIEYYGSSLILKSNTIMRHYFKVSDGTDVSNYDFSGNNDDYYYIDNSNISADKLDLASQTTIGDFTISCSPMSYAYAVLKNSAVNDNLKNLVKSLYIYNQTAKTYKETVED